MESLLGEFILNWASSPWVGFPFALVSYLDAHLSVLHTYTHSWTMKVHITAQTF